MGQTIANNASTRFLVPYVLAQKEGTDIRTGWDSALGLYNPSGQSQRYIFKFYDDSGILVVQFRSGLVPAKNNLFETPETIAENSNVFKPINFFFEVQQGDPTPLRDRSFSGYAIVEHDGLTQSFYLSSWMARGGSDFTVQPPEEPKSFGFNRVSWQIPAIPVSIYSGKTTQKIISPGFNLKPKTTDDNCPQPSATGVPNGWDGGVSLVNVGASSVTVRLSFIADGSSTPTNSPQTQTIGAAQRVGIVVSNHLPNNLGKGVLVATVESGTAPLLGFASQSDARFQFFGYGITGQVVFNEGSGPTPAIITNLSANFIIPYAVRAGNTPPRNGNDTGISVFNPQPSQITVTFNFYREEGSVAATLSFSVPANGAFYKRMHEFPIADGFIGWVQVTSQNPFYSAAQVVRGGFDTELFGWQSFGFDVPAIPASTVSSIPGTVCTAVNETTAVGEICPPLSPEETDPHKNGFDVGVRILNAGTSAVGVRLEFQKRSVGGSSVTADVSPSGPYTLNPNQSKGLVIGVDFQNPGCPSPPCPTDRTDGMLIVRLVSGSPGKVVCVAAQGDKFFKWFSYSVIGQQVSVLP